MSEGLTLMRWIYYRFGLGWFYIPDVSLAARDHKVPSITSVGDIVREINKNSIVEDHPGRLLERRHASLRANGGWSDYQYRFKRGRSAWAKQVVEDIGSVPTPRTRIMSGKAREHLTRMIRLRVKSQARPFYAKDMSYEMVGNGLDAHFSTDQSFRSFLSRACRRGWLKGIRHTHTGEVGYLYSWVDKNLPDELRAACPADEGMLLWELQVTLAIFTSELCIEPSEAIEGATTKMSGTMEAANATRQELFQLSGGIPFHTSKFTRKMVGPGRTFKNKKAYRVFVDRMRESGWLRGVRDDSTVRAYLNVWTAKVPRSWYDKLSKEEVLLDYALDQIGVLSKAVPPDVLAKAMEIYYRLIEPDLKEKV